MSLFGRLSGIFFNPGRTFRRIAERPVWVDALVITLILVCLYSYLVFPYGQKDNLAFLENNAAQLKQQWGEERYAFSVDRIEGRDRILTAFLITPLTHLSGWLFSALVVLGMGRLVSPTGHYLQVFSSFLHAGFVDILLGNALRMVLVLKWKSVVQTSTRLTVFFPGLDVMSAAYGILGQIDFFQLWMFGLLGIGLAASFKIHLKKALVISLAFWLLKTSLMITLTLAGL
ncbi:MAG: YIP1 family protein, partial [Candidatus Aminicenantes bacterium]|nr:YIP1 family protein [Candidatus Aminicenantes bacterium]